MKRSFIHTLLSLLFAALFFFAGTGYNVVHFCCHSCQDAGLGMVAELSCEKVHLQHKRTQHGDGNCCADATTTTCSRCADGDTCTLKRLTVDIPIIKGQNSSLTSNNTHLLVQAGFYFQTLLPANYYSEKAHTIFPPPHRKISLLSGRIILSQKSVLII